MGTCRQVWSPGVLDVEKMVLQESTLLSARLFAGLTMPCLVIMEPIVKITALSMDILVMFVELGWTGKYQILRKREMELENSAESLRDRFKDSRNARLTGRNLKHHWLMFQIMEGQLRRSILNLGRTW